MKDESNNRTALQATHMEPTSRGKPVGEEIYKRFHPPVYIHVHSIRKRLADADGISAKALIDGLVHRGILWDDNPIFVKEVSFSQEKGKEEKTIITITDEKTG